MKRIGLAVLIACMLASPARSQQFIPLIEAELRDLLHESLSGEVAKDHVIQISRHHRIQGSRGYRDAAHYVLQQLHNAGFTQDDAFMESFPSDGKIVYQTWQSPSGWDIDWAELRMVEPYDERIVGYPEIAMSLITYSNPGDVTAELVWVGSGTRDEDYEGKDVVGKFVLATGYGGNVHRLAVLRYGAAGVVAYIDDDRAKEYPDMLQYTGMWPLTEELEQVTFGFNLSNRQGERLRDMLLAGQRVVMRGVVRGIGLESYFLDVPVARIPGSDPNAGVFVVSAHLDHPKESANDNASGSAATLDMAITLKRLIDSGELVRPKHSLQFMWVPEWYGTMAYIDAHPEMSGPALGGEYLMNINMDMVGEHLELLHSRFIMTRVPYSTPTVVNDVVLSMAQMVDGMNVRTARGSQSRFNYQLTPYSGGSDHMMFIDRRIPGVMFGHSPDYTHHTSDDTPDKVDPVELERTEIVATASMLYLADLSPEQGVDLAHLVGAASAERLGASGRRANRLLVSAAGSRDAELDPWFEAENVVRHVAQWEREAVSSVLYYNDAEQVRQVLEVIHGQLEGQERAIMQSLRDQANSLGISTSMGHRSADNRVPVRLTRGPLDFGLPESQLTPEAAAWYSSQEIRLSGNERFELVNFIDGERSVTELRDALSAEFRPLPLGIIARYLDDLVQVGVVTWAR
ncbi:MAG: M28 family peptidase [Gemmatimonadota bacterium]|nr:MAG: M28 family peptidase [Gemmatimonadota bacterium]